ncbi:MAG: radical SAM family heme chaperone HemW [Bacteroidales bacterium]|nr:radical SAM family heme chaperone HemW [Bacteroidales bacterium]
MSVKDSKTQLGLVYLSFRNQIPSSHKMAGVYIHIPFCRKICHYCDFYRVTAVADAPVYVRALIKEMELRADYLEGEPVETIYFGGGTPTVMDALWLKELLQAISEYHIVADNCEITLEANPDDLTDDYLRSIRKSTPVNRLSIGIQSFHNHELQLMNRRHTAEEAYDCIERAYRHGFTNISADLIYGMPGSTTDGLHDNLDRMFALDIQHLSAYHITIEPKTEFYRMVEKGMLIPVTEEESLAQFRTLIERLRQRGFIHYELSNWAREGYFSKHNTNYWKRKLYLGLGPSSHSYNRISRQWNVSDITIYMKALETGFLPFEKENLDPVKRFNEHLLTLLRTMWGVDLKEIGETYGAEVSERLLKSSEKYVRSGHIQLNGETIMLTDEGYFISDAIVRNLMMDD